MTDGLGLEEKLDQLRAQVASVIRGKDEVIENLLIALLAGGSVLIEDVPGVGKTTLAKTLAASVDLEFNRVQCTPDLLPGDIFGFSVLNPADGSFRFRQGPIFCNVLLVDEINRASPRTQAALLEAMAEHQVTIEGTKYELLSPFTVLATQNPSEHHGTFPLPESQLDRFLFLLSMDYPSHESEVELLYSHGEGTVSTDLSPVISRKELLECHQQVRNVYVEKSVADFIVGIAQRTRQDARVRLGCSPRGTLMVFQAAKAKAFLNGRNYVAPDDVLHVAPLALRHRLVMDRQALGETEPSLLIQEFLQEVPLPT